MILVVTCSTTPAVTLKWEPPSHKLDNFLHFNKDSFSQYMILYTVSMDKKMMPVKGLRPNNGDWQIIKTRDLGYDNL